MNSKLEQIIKKTGKFLYDQYPKVAGVGIGAGMYSLIKPIYLVSPTKITTIFSQEAITIGATIFGYLGYEFIQSKKDKKEVLEKDSKKNLENLIEPEIKKKEKSFSNILKKIYDWPLKHPKTTAIVLALKTFDPPLKYFEIEKTAIKMAHNFWKRGDDFNEIIDVFTQLQPPIQYHQAAAINLSVNLIGFYVFTKLIAPFINSKDINSNRYMLPGVTMMALKKHKKAKKLLEKSITINPSSWNHLVLTRLYQKQNNLPKTIQHIGEYLSRYSKDDSLWNKTIQSIPFINISNIKSIKKKNKVIDSGKATINDYIELSINHFSVGNFNNVCKTFENSIKKYPKNELELNCLYAYALNVMNKDAEPQWKKVIELMLNNDSLKYEQIGESKNKVLMIEEEGILKNSFIFKESKDKESLEKEIKLTNELDEIISSHSQYKVPHDISITEYQGKYIYSMIRENGKTLMELIEAETAPFGHIKNIAEYLSLIHAKTPIYGLKTINYHEKIKRVLTDVPQVDSSLKDLIIDNIHPVIDAFDDAILVFNKDAHPQNWLITEYDEITAIDIEDKGAVPAEFDLANLIEYSNFFTNDSQGDEKRKEIIEHYKENYVKYSRDITALENINEFRYLNAVIQRTLSLYSAWSSPSRKSLWGSRKIIVDNALHSIDRLSIEYKDYFNQNNKNYNNLITALKELESIAQSI
ncbi:hypothetical protein ISS04_02415 [Candidatus Woesearchaeota archaeon]|nr:hypothetical protein [Candidatus Woesearchaeota archaeon]